jgi:hypothetical protein
MNNFSLLLPGLTTPRLYVVPGNQFIYQLIVSHVGGQSLARPDTMTYFYNSILITPCHEVDGLMYALAATYRCYLQKTLIYLPIQTKGINIYIPNGSKADIYASYIPS